MTSTNVRFFAWHRPEHVVFSKAILCQYLDGQFRNLQDSAGRSPQPNTMAV